MAAKKGTRVTECGFCEGVYVATGAGSAVCDKDENHATTTWGGDFDLTRAPLYHEAGTPSLSRHAHETSEEP